MKTMEREKIHIDKAVLSKLLHPGDVAEYEHTENRITSSDESDGGADHVVVIKRLADGKYFSFNYSDWDLEYNFDRDFPEELSEVFPEQVTITIYK